MKVPILQCHFERHIHRSSPQLTKLSKGTTVGMTAAHYGTPSAFFAIVKSFKGMNKHVLNPNGGYTALSFLPAAIRAKEARSNQPLPRLLG